MEVRDREDFHGFAGSESSSTYGSSLRENREIPPTSEVDGDSERFEKASGRTSDMHVSGKSDEPIVVTKPTNNGPTAVGRAEGVERRGSAKGKADRTHVSRTQSRTHGTPPGLIRLREAARRNRKERFTALLHHVNVELLRTSFYALKRGAAAGVDGMTWEQ